MKRVMKMFGIGMVLSAILAVTIGGTTLAATRSGNNYQGDCPCGTCVCDNCISYNHNYQHSEH